MSIISVFSYLYTLVGPGVKNEAYVDEPQLLQRKSSTVEARYMNYPTNEEVTELNQVNTIFCMLRSCVCNNICVLRMMVQVIMRQ